MPTFTVESGNCKSTGVEAPSERAAMALAVRRWFECSADQGEKPALGRLICAYPTGHTWRVARWWCTEFAMEDARQHREPNHGHRYECL